MTTKTTPYSRRMQRSSSQMHRFINKLCVKGNEHLRFLLVHDSERDRRDHANSAHSLNSLNTAGGKQAIPLHKPLLLLEKQVPQIRLISKQNKPIHLLSHNAQGYAVFMEINRRGNDGDIAGIRAQFIDVDLNKVSGKFPTRELLRHTIKRLKSDPAEKLASINITRSKQGDYVLKAQRTEARVTQLKQEFLRKHWHHIKKAMIVETKNGYHIYWPLLSGSVGPFVPIQKALSDKFGSDPMITNLTRVMRVPGFYHMKDPVKPYMVRVIHWGREGSFTQEELIRSLGLRML
ncbi:DNA-primase RepB domain-containing protein [Paenibacillus sp. GCM10023248]|uniref:DNA-primase RepB domain-containing protein n=1 Tax=unclassified Paenibacillus TaxID=185978 RepID=UPI0023796233|nr:hypothetical protein [Paenibacillus sp. MAHUQ-63]MDD9270915.1 hypothetical protein [Paenibacillus sp. MAHUQ-63]